MARILVVDDEATIRHVIRATLEMEGHEITEAGDGKVALECVHNEIPDLIITDIIMPVKEGIETIFEIRERYPRVRIIAMSSVA